MFAEIAVVNHSTLLVPNPDDAMRAMVLAIGKQLARDYATSWSHVPPALVYYPNATDAPATSALVVVADDADQAGVLGYHTDTMTGPRGFVFAGPVMAAGGSVSSGSMSVSCTLSHEVLELIADPFCNTWSDDTLGGVDTSFELCDPVESDSYTIDGVAVSNFVLPSYFDPSARVTEKFDFMGTLSAPFTMSPGGYKILRDSTGIREVFGRLMTAPAHIRKQNPYSRIHARKYGGRK